MAKFYMKNASSTAFPGEIISIEESFKGLAYLNCKGLLNKGKPKNIYTENYADADGVRMWQGEKIAREATIIEFEFVFIGEERQSTYESFYEYLKIGKISYWDDVRKKEALMVLTEALEPSEDIYVGSVPYIKATFKFQNIWGECPESTGITV